VDPAAPVGLVALDLAGRDPVDLDPAPLDLVSLATPVGLVDLADLVGQAVPADTNRVPPEATGDTGLVDRGSPVVRVDLANPGVRGRVARADMILAGPEDLGIQDRAERCTTAQEPKGRTAVRVLSQDRVRLALTPTAPDRARPGRTLALRARMPAHLHRMPADLDRTRPAEPARRVEVTRRVAVTLRVAAILAVAAAAILPAERALTGNTAMVLASRSGARRVTDRERLCAQAFQGDLGG
jgi:hypothetical protein